jgi:uncharacterized membrane protein
MTYLLLKWIHILAAITALGSNITYGFWLTRASRQPAVLPFTLKGVKLIDDRIANPAYGVALISGFGMVHVGHLSLRTPWLLSALVLYALMVIIAVAGYTPTLKRQIQAVERGGAESAAYRALQRRGRVLGAVLAVIVLTIVFLMVVKPTLW